MTELRTCAIIPTHNHVVALGPILSRLAQYDLFVVVVDDGSAPEPAQKITAICAEHAHVEYVRHRVNAGKGAAVLSGLSRAQKLGFTHAVQIDADGQHDLDGLETLLKAARGNPSAIITGVPLYDSSIPHARRIWRPFTNFWVRVNTLSRAIPDALCGFRVYPVCATLALAQRSVRVTRMDFDIEVLVKAYWARFQIVSVPVRVTYPKGNFSNFDLLWDNVRLSRMQARLFVGMLLRAPFLVFTRPVRVGQTARWPQMQERGVYWGLRFVAGVYRLFGRKACLCVMAPIVLYFFATGHEQRRASRDYLARLWKYGLLDRKPGLWLSLRHFMSFTASALDKLSAWAGDIPLSQVQGVKSGLIRQVEASGRGIFVITAHIGNPEVIRAFSVLGKSVRINVLMHTDHAQHFNRLIQKFSPDAPVRAFAVTKVGIDTAMILSQAIENGEWVVMVGDRVPVHEQGRVVEASFLGAPAAFPQGPYILGALLKAPTYLLFCTRAAKGFNVYFTKFADRIELPRADRMAAIGRYAAQYAKVLEERVAQTPLQWFNFYAFWRAAPQIRAQAPNMQRAAE